jgi:diguanylate cyclase (GGDEF)-like protein
MENSPKESALLAAGVRAMGLPVLLLETSSRKFRVVYANGAFEAVSGRTGGSLLGRELTDCLDTEVDANALLQALQRDRRFDGTLRYRTAHGRSVSLAVQIARAGDDASYLMAVHLPMDGPWGVDCRRSSTRGDGSALQPASTTGHRSSPASAPAPAGGDGRAQLRARLEQALAHAKRHARTVAYLSLDLDRFRRINTSLGHQVGDALLEQVAQRIRKPLRADDMVVRTGDDEFGVIFADVASSHDVSRLTERLLGAFDEPFDAMTQQVPLSASVGVAIGPADQGSPARLMSDAERAARQAKAQGGRTFVFSQNDTDRFGRRRLRLELELRNALKEGQLSLAFQPQVSISTGEVEGVEALLRWFHPRLGWIPPGEFIEVAEESGLIVDVDEWVIDNVCREVGSWRGGAMRHLKVALNISARHFHRASLVERLRSSMREHGVPPERLCLEVTEHTLAGDRDRAIEVLTALKAMGVSIAIDDFGTGYCSFAYLKDFPVDIIKLDGSFVSDVETDSGRGIVEAMATMARCLGITTIAEKVETAAQWRALRSVGCEIGQGFVSGRPMPVEDLTAMVDGGEALESGIYTRGGRQTDTAGDASGTA